jgi:chromosome segregation ATPase
MITHQKKILFSLVVSTLFSSSLLAKSSEEIVESIMKLRAEVESLYTQIDENKDYYKAQMKSLSMQSADSEAQINRERTSIKLAESELQKIQTKIENSSSNNVELKPLISDAIAQLQSSIKAGIPFQVQERLASLEKIKTQLNENEITSERALAMVWASYDDAIRLTKEIGIFKQQISINDKKLLAKVAKIGSVMIYFQAPDESVGYVSKTDTGYEYKVVNNAEDVKKITALFDALQKQIRTGYFTLPNALVLMENK